MLFDSVRLADPRTDLGIFENLIQFFSNEEDISGPDEFSPVKPFPTYYKLLKNILTTSYLKDTIRKNRLENIREAIINNNRSQSITIKYVAPFYNLENVLNNFFYLIFSQSMLEYLTQITGFYKQANKLLKPGGVMSHQIDLTSVGVSEQWDGHWTYSDLEWNLMRDKNCCITNRDPHSNHFDTLREAGLNIIHDMKRTNNPNFTRDKLAKPFRNLSDDNLCTSGMYILATKN